MDTKGLIFDLDGTVTMTQQYHVESYLEIFKRHGLNYTAEDDIRFSGSGPHCTFPAFFKEHNIAYHAHRPRSSGPPALAGSH